MTRIFKLGLAVCFHCNIVKGNRAAVRCLKLSEGTNGELAPCCFDSA